MYVRLSSGAEVSVPISTFPRLLAASAAQRRDYRLEERGTGIHWPQLDEDIGVAGLLGLSEDAVEEAIGLC
jgi:hypothetical protein